MKKEKKARPPLKGSNPAKPNVRVWIERLITVRKESMILAKRSKLLRKLIMGAGGGSAHGARTYVHHVRAHERVSYVRAHDELRIVIDEKGE